MTFEAAVEARIAAILAVVELAPGGVVWGLRFEAVPAIALQIVADPRPQHFKGFQSTRSTSVQVDVWATLPDTARALREAIIKGVAGPVEIGGVTFQRAIVTNVRASGVGEGGGQSRDGDARDELARESIDIDFWHNG